MQLIIGLAQVNPFLFGLQVKPVAEVQSSLYVAYVTFYKKF